MVHINENVANKNHNKDVVDDSAVVKLVEFLLTALVLFFFELVDFLFDLGILQVFLELCLLCTFFGCLEFSIGQTLFRLVWILQVRTRGRLCGNVLT